MPTSNDYLDFVLEQLSDMDDISYRQMMGEYILYFRGKIFGGIYDNRFLIRPVPAALKKMPDAKRELPYEGAAEMLLVSDPEDKDFLCELLEAMYEELPEVKRRKKRK